MIGTPASPPPPSPPAGPPDDNPLAAGLERLPVRPTTLVIFGATGDLAKRKLLPALYNLAHEGALPERFHLVGTSRSELGDDAFRDEAAAAIRAHSRREPDEDVLAALLQGVRWVSGGFDEAAVYEEIARTLDELDARGAGRPANRVFYLSTAPGFFATIVERLGAQGLHRCEEADTRIVIEKPFGADLASATELNRRVLDVFTEPQVFRIDHYLGKETVQNLLAFRFANRMFEPLWNRDQIASVQITAAEDIGIGSRAGYYDGAGALRDLVQNHMLQLLCLLCMEPPADLGADEVRNEKVKVLKAIRPTRPQDVDDMAVRAQYAAGTSGGEEVPAYLDEERVPDDSTTETYAALRLGVQNWRWAGVPFYLRTGKRLARKVTEIAVTLKPVPHVAFDDIAAVAAGGTLAPNELVMTIQPNEGVSLSLGAKIPGTRMRIRPVQMEFLYGTAFVSQSPEAYERLILDAMRGDATLFTRGDEAEAQWRICEPIVERWHDDADPPALPRYAAGSQGPSEADALLRPGDRWRRI